MKPGKETENLKLDSGFRSRIRRFLSGLAWFLAAIGIIVGVVGMAQQEVPMRNMDSGWVMSYSYWGIFKFSGPLAMLFFLLMAGSLAYVSFWKNAAGSERLNLVCLLPLILGSSMAFLLLTGAWLASVEGGMDAEIAIRYHILESKLQILVGATASLLCYLITRLRLRFSQPKNQ